MDTSSIPGECGATSPAASGVFTDSASIRKETSTLPKWIAAASRSSNPGRARMPRFSWASPYTPHGSDVVRRQDTKTQRHKGAQLIKLCLHSLVPLCLCVLVVQTTLAQAPQKAADLFKHDH